MREGVGLCADSNLKVTVEYGERATYKWINNGCRYRSSGTRTPKTNHSCTNTREVTPLVYAYERLRRFVVHPSL